MSNYAGGHLLLALLGGTTVAQTPPEQQGLMGSALAATPEVTPPPSPPALGTGISCTSTPVSERIDDARNSAPLSTPREGGSTVLDRVIVEPSGATALIHVKPRIDLMAHAAQYPPHMVFTPVPSVTVTPPPVTLTVTMGTTPTVSPTPMPTLTCAR